MNRTRPVEIVATQQPLLIEGAAAALAFAMIAVWIVLLGSAI